MPTTSAFVAIVGRPNVGKSSLLNRLVGRKVAIVSNRPQTTRSRIMGVMTREELQLVFLDTPGAHRPKSRLGDFMVQSITDAVSGVDAGLLVVEPDREPSDEEKKLLEQFRKQELPVILAVNKIDTVAQKETLLTCLTTWQACFDFAAIVPVSAVTGEGVDTLVDEMKAFAFPSPHFFPDDAVSDQPEKVLAAELIREKMLQLLRDEVPHGVAVDVESLTETKTNAGADIIDVEAVIYCDRDSHKGIIIGKRGAMLREISTKARLEMESLFSSKVNLQCWVKVKEDWKNRQGFLNALGYQL